MSQHEDFPVGSCFQVHEKDRYCIYSHRQLYVHIIMYMYVHVCIMQPRLSGPRLSGTSIIQTCLRTANTLVRMRRGHDQ